MAFSIRAWDFQIKIALRMDFLCTMVEIADSFQLINSRKNTGLNLDNLSKIIRRKRKTSTLNLYLVYYKKKLENYQFF